MKASHDILIKAQDTDSSRNKDRDTHISLVDPYESWNDRMAKQIDWDIRK